MQRRPKRSKKRPYLAIGLVLLILGIGAATYFFMIRTTAPDSSNTPDATKQSAEQEDPHPDRIRILASGDMVAHDSVNANAQQSDGSYDYLPLLSKVQPLFSAADIRFCNQVTPAGGTEFGVAGYPEFNAPTELVRDMGTLGCNLVNTASNHSFDVGQEAINANVDAWNDVETTLAVAGQNKSAAERDSVDTFEVKGVKFAFLAYTTYINANAPATNDYGVNVYSRAFAAEQIKQAKDSGADVVIVSMRWGTEYASTINAQQEAESNWLAGQGVSIILGHGPHVLQPVKEIEQRDGSKTVVWYSLGNFLNTQLEPEALFNGLGVIDIDRNTKKVTSLSYVPVYSSYSWTAQQAAAEDLLARDNVSVATFDDVSQETITANQLKTTLAEQLARIRDTLNTFTTVEILNKQNYLR